ncbi:MAG: hypothetical protein NTW21_27340 [Verrucomicrobia bacterium]|nr:hypothetical protein [Verrucomicrobiota bacterium]
MNATPNPILEDLWRTKDDLAREAGGDVRRLCENTRRWAAAHPHRGPHLKDAIDLRTWLARQGEPEVLMVREDPPLDFHEPRGGGK